MKTESPLARRQYGMKARAQSAAATGERILDAAVTLFWERPVDQIALDEVARRAEVSVQTVIRRFGGKDGLVAAAIERENARVVDQRMTAPVGDTAGTVRVLIDHYERLGDRVMRLLAEENSSDTLRTIVESGRQLHRDWCAHVFDAALVDLDPAQRRRRFAQLVAICDVYTWKLLRRDAGLDRSQAELALVEMLEPLLTPSIKEN